MVLQLALAFLFRLWLIVAAARLVYDLIIPVTLGFLIVLASLIVIRVVLARYGPLKGW